MKNNYLFCLLLLSNLTSFFAEAKNISEKPHSMMLIEQAYIRAVIPGTSISSSYMEIENKSEEAITLLGATSLVSPRIEIHQHTMLDGMMRMRKVEGIVIKPKKRIKLQPSGLHLMVFDVNNTLNSQEQINITLHFSNNESVVVPVSVYSPTQERAAQEATSNMHKHHH